MSSWRELAVAVALLAAAGAARGFEGVGRPATPAEIAAWAIDVRPDFEGLPRGSGSVARGQELWDAKCASCHGTFGESNEVFPPLVGGTTPEDVETGHVKALATGSSPHRTTLMKVNTVSTLWDYIRRAMPWNAPRSLSADDTYAVLAYLLNLGDLVPADFVLDQDTIRDVQRRMPNRHGMTRAHGLWDLHGKPDVHERLCMKDCGPAARVSSSLPDSARGSHGNLAEQNRTFGPVRGVDTSRPRGSPPALAAAAPPPAAPAPGLAAVRASGCLACHDVQARRLGPSFREVGGRYAKDPAAPARLASSVTGGSRGAWGAIPMPPQAKVTKEDVAKIVDWVLQGAP
jgi:cytochrome c